MKTFSILTKGTFLCSIQQMKLSLSPATTFSKRLFKAHIS